MTQGVRDEACMTTIDPVHIQHKSNESDESIRWYWMCQQLISQAQAKGSWPEEFWLIHAEIYCNSILCLAWKCFVICKKETAATKA